MTFQAVKDYYSNLFLNLNTAQEDGEKSRKFMLVALWPLPKV